MTYTADSALFQRIVDDSIDIGYIRRPQNWKGHQYEPRVMRRQHGAGCWICCIPCFGRVNDELAILVGTVFFVFSAFIAFAYTARSAQSACEANHDLATIRYKQRQPIPQPAFNRPPPASYVYTVERPPLYAPNAEPSLYPQVYPQQHLPPQHVYQAQPAQVDLYQEAVVLLEGRRTERTWVAIAQGAVCVGAALLTAALLATLIVEGELLMFECGFAGVGLIAAGTALYAGTKCFHFNHRQQEAAENISRALYPAGVY